MSCWFQSKVAMEAIEEVKAGLACLQAQVNDIGRQTSKCSISFEGTAVRKLEEELPKDTLNRLVHLGWGFTPKEWEVADVKIRSKDKAGKKFRMLAFFNARYEGSTFHRILTIRPAVSGKDTLFRSLHMVTDNDHRLAFIARTMRRAGELKSSFWVFSSGRLRVHFPNGNRRNFSEASDLYAVCSKQTQDKIDAEDKKQRKSRKRNNSHADI